MTASTRKAKPTAHARKQPKPAGPGGRGTAILSELPPAPPERCDDGEIIEFLKAIDTFKRRTGRTFPSWSEVLDIVKHLGYRKP